MSIRTVLFDLFGTLVPCYPLRCLSVVVREMALDVGVDPETFEAEWTRTLPSRFAGDFATVEDNLIHVVGQLGQRCCREAVDAATHRRIAFEQTTLLPRPGATAILDELRSKGLRIGLITNCAVETVQAWAGCILAQYVDHVTFSCIVGTEKPNPGAYFDALEALEAHPGECLFVGDGSSDELAGAARLGMDAVLIRGEDDDGSFPGRIDPSDWHGPSISRLTEVTALVERS